MKKKIIPLVSLLALVIAIIPVAACALLYPSSYPSSCPPSGEGTPPGGGTPSVNQPPVLDFIGNRMVSEGQLLTFTISAADPDGDFLVYSASNLPTGSNFTPATRTFCWTPDHDQAGNYTGNYTKSYPGVHFDVTDGELTDYQEITITVVNVTLNTTVDLDSDTINLEAPRNWLTVYLELSTEYQPGLVDLLTLKLSLNATQIPAVTDPKYDFVTDPGSYTTDKDGDGILERMVKFDWSLVKPLLELGYCTLLVNGRFLGWPALPDFEGADTVLVIS